MSWYETRLPIAVPAFSTYNGSPDERHQRGTVRVLTGNFIRDGEHRSSVARDPRGWPANRRLTGGTITITLQGRDHRVSVRPVVDPLADTMGPWS